MPTNPGDSFTIIHTTAGVIGTFNGVAEGSSVVTSDGTTFTITYKGNGGDDVVLTESAMPAVLIVTTQPPSPVVAGAGFSLIVKAEVAGQVTSTFNGIVQLALASNPGGSTLGGTVSVMAVNGVATFNALSLNKVGTGYTLQLTSGALGAATTNPFDVIAGAAAQLVVTGQPPTSVVASTAFPLEVTALDSSGNVATTFANDVTVTIGANPGSSTLSGTTTVTAINGVAEFTDLMLDKVGLNYTLQVSSGSLVTGTTNPFNVIPGVATQLQVTTEPPGTVTAGIGFGLTVSALDVSGNVDTSYSGDITMSVAANPGNSTLGGTVTMMAINGVVTYSDLTLNKVGSGYTLEADASGLTAGTSSTITVVPGVATGLTITSQPVSPVSAGSSFGLVATAIDSSGNVATSFTGPVTMSLDANPGSSTLTGGITVSAINGVATFTSLKLNKAAMGYTLDATSGSLSIATTNPFDVVAGAPAQLVVTQSPPNDVQAGVGFGLEISAEDTLGNVSTTFGGTIRLTLAANPGGSTLNGPLTMVAVNGVADFSNLTLNNSGTGYTIKATSGVLSTAQTAPFSVVAGPATILLVTNQPPLTAFAGKGFDVAVVAEDAAGNLATDFTGPVSVDLDNNPTGATLSGPNLTVNAVNGVADLPGLSLNLVGSGYTLELMSGTLMPAVTSPFDVAAGTLTNLQIVTPPPSVVTAGSSFSIAVAAEDNSGNIGASYNGNVTISLATNPGSGTLGGTLTEPAVNGIATFSDLTLNQAGVGYSISAASPGLTPATTNTFEVDAAAATQLVVTTPPPGSVVSGAPFGFVVDAEDASGNTDMTFSGSVTVTIAANPGGATLSGPVTVSAVNGVATFSGLSLDKAGSGYTLEVDSSGVSAGTTGAITVTPGVATQLAVTTQPPATVNPNGVFGLVVSAEDALGNVDPTYTGVVTLNLANNPGGGTLSGTLTAQAVKGVATFSNLSLDVQASGYILQATSGSLNSITTNPINVAQVVPTHLVVTQQPPSAVTAGAGFGLTVTAEDDAGNPASAYNGFVTLSLSNNPGGSTLGGTTTVPIVNGSAVFSGLTLNFIGTAYSLNASSSGLTQAPTTSFNVVAGQASQLVIVSQPPNSVAPNMAFNVVVEAEDSLGNVSTAFNGSVTANLSTNPNGATLGGTLSVNAVNGVATFGNLTINKGGLGYILQFTSGNQTPVTTNSINVGGIAGIGLSNTTVTEFRPTGTLVGVLSSSESGTGHTYTYSLVPGTGSSGNSSFVIVGNQLQTNDAFNAAAQSTYFIRVRSTDEQNQSLDQVFTISITDDPNLTLSNRIFTVMGTSGNDAFSFISDPVRDSLSLNGVKLAVDTASIDAIVFNGNGGVDSANVTGSVAGTNSLTLTPGSSKLTGPGYAISLVGVQTITAHATTPTDTAFLFDTTGSNTFVGSPSYSTFTGTGFADTMLGFATIKANAASGTNDSAYLYDAPGNNQFVGATGFGTLTGSAYSFTTVGFKAVNAFGVSGGNDTAYLYDTSGSNAFVGTTGYSYFTGKGFFNQVVAFQTVNAFAAKGTTDGAYLYDNGGNNAFVGTPTYSYLTNSVYFDQAVGFASVNATATNHSNDAAYLFSSSGSNTFVGAAGYSYLEGTGYFNQVVGFHSVSATAGAGTTDVAYLFGNSGGGNTFIGTTGYGYMYGTGYLNDAVGFKVVSATGAGTSSDVATLFDGPGTNYFAASGSNGTLSTNGLVYGGDGFSQVRIVQSLGDNDQTFLGTYNYHLTISGTWH